MLQSARAAAAQAESARPVCAPFIQNIVRKVTGHPVSLPDFEAWALVYFLSTDIDCTRKKSCGGPPGGGERQAGPVFQTLTMPRVVSEPTEEGSVTKLEPEANPKPMGGSDRRSWFGIRRCNLRFLI